MRILILIVAALWLAGCASTSGPAVEARRSEVLLQLDNGRCDEELSGRVQSLREPDLLLQAAWVCVQQMQTDAAEGLLKTYTASSRQTAHADYAAYLQAVTSLLRFQLAGEDDRQRLVLGREAHQRYAAFVREYPLSAYRQDAANHLQQLHDAMAAAEYRLARLALETGRADVGQQRLRYLQREYPRSPAAADANVLLQQLQGLGR